MVERLSRAWLAATVLLLLLATADFLLDRGDGLTDFFFHAQDLPVLEGVSLVAAGLWLSPALRAAALGLVDRIPHLSSRGAAIGISALTAVIALIGVSVVCENYPLSMDEFMATFDAVIYGHGQAMAPIAPHWRDFAPALQTMFMLPTSGHAIWVSAYLPVNAALRGLAGDLGAARAFDPLLAAVSVLAVYAVARQLWPERRDLAIIAAILLATSSQFLVTAMTPYAMTAHLALNLVWLWLFLRGGALGHAGALVVAFLACGLHQLIFHPLFAAPFVLQLWLERRWRVAALYSLAYAAICGFWVLYWPIATTLSGAASGAGASLGAPWLISRVAALFADFDPGDIGEMAKNLIRFMTWQNPLAVCLSIVGFPAALRAKGAVRSLAAGLALTPAAMFVLLTYQGHGWGYRYLHGLLGSFTLIAALAWGRLTDGMAAERRTVANGAFAAIAAAALVVLLPIRAWQAHGFLHHYAAAEAAIRRAPADVVLVNDNGIWFGQDLVRNDPYLRNRPLVMNLGVLTEAQIRLLCSRYALALFDRRDAKRFGVPTFEPSDADAPDLEAPLRADCKPPPAAITRR